MCVVVHACTSTCMSAADVGDFHQSLISWGRLSVPGDNFLSWLCLRGAPVSPFPVLRLLVLATLLVWNFNFWRFKFRSPGVPGKYSTEWAIFPAYEISPTLSFLSGILQSLNTLDCKCEVVLVFPTINFNYIKSIHFKKYLMLYLFVYVCLCVCMYTYM